MCKEHTGIRKTPKVEELIRNELDDAILGDQMSSILCNYLDQMNNNIIAIREETQSTIKNSNKGTEYAIRELDKKFDKTNGLLSNTNTSLSVLQTKFDGHLKVHEEKDNKNKNLSNNITIMIASILSAIIGSYTTLKTTNII